MSTLTHPSTTAAVNADGIGVDTVGGLIDHWSRASPDAVAVAAPGRDPLTYADLRRQVGDVRRRLAAVGFGRGDRVALVLPDGPELAVAFLAVAAAATAVPLNPALTEAELGLALDDLRPAAIVLHAGVDGPARSAATARALPILNLMPGDGPAGRFALDAAGGQAVAVADPEPDDVALLLTTSGTTARPKLVPLTHANLCASARHIAATLDLRPADRCLVVMPLFHIHGLVGALLASVAAGASVACAPGFQPARFFDWLAECRPSWYTAVPTMHRAVLDRAPAHADLIARHPLRFVRSSSASLPPSTLAELEAAFGAPVVEAYGMTEAAHQMASNPLPPRPRKPGSVGPAAGPRVAVLGEGGDLLPPDGVGEVVIRGPNVTRGYLDNPAANAAAVVDGWFRTGDQGYLDADGYLFLTGRLKELINRGGEKIAPREVEEALLAHPAVAQAVAFALPDQRLGEDVAAAVVLRPGHQADEAELRRVAAERLAPFKLPRRVVTVEDLPKGPTGKLQRVGLAERLGLAAPTPASAPFVAPRTPFEELVAATWAEALGVGVERIGAEDDFFALGGPSLLAAQVVARLREDLGIDLPLTALFEAPTVARLALAVEELLVAEDDAAPSAEGRQVADGRSPRMGTS